MLAVKESMKYSRHCLTHCCSSCLTSPRGFIHLNIRPYRLRRHRSHHTTMSDSIVECSTVKCSIVVLDSLTQANNHYTIPKAPLVTSAIRALLYVYAAHRYNVYTLMPRTVKILLSQAEGQRLVEEVIVQGLQEVGTFNKLLSPWLSCG